MEQIFFMFCGMVPSSRTLVMRYACWFHTRHAGSAEPSLSTSATTGYSTSVPDAGGT
jgi:hypothetical protein